MTLQVHASQYPSKNFFVGVPSDSTLLPRTTRGFIVTADGNLVVQNSSGVSVTIPVTIGQVITLSPDRLMAATTASVVVLA